MGVGAFLIWSFTPFYFDAIQQLQVVEIVAHRFLWCIPFMAVVLFIGRQWADGGSSFCLGGIPEAIGPSGCWVSVVSKYIRSHGEEELSINKG